MEADATQQVAALGKPRTYSGPEGLQDEVCTQSGELERPGVVHCEIRGG